jgi:nucleoside-diphosphate-sugar epimerase
MRDERDHRQLYLDVNAHATRRLAEAAARAGVQRFLYVSSIKVNGEETLHYPFKPVDPPNPRDDYGLSKCLGEQSLLKVAASTGMRVAIVRPPLVYGPGVRANFLRLLRWVDRGWPLPLGSINNRRSLVSVWNLCDLLRRLLEDPLPGMPTWLVSDGEDLSTPELIRRIAAAMARRANLLPCPPSVLQAAGAVLGRSAEVGRLCGSLVVDVSQTQQQLRWSPPLSVDEALARTVRWYLTDDRTRAR